MARSLRQLQLQELEMLKEIAECLNNAGITFYLTGGSCIGVLRHKGFIPWDDDIDIGIMRCDFNAAEAALKTLDDSMIYDSVENHIIPDAPLGHVFKNEQPLDKAPCIDVFAIDNVPNGKLAKKYQNFCAKVYHLCVLRRPSENRGKLNHILTSVICSLPKKMLDFFQRRAYNGLIRWQYEDTEYVSNVFGVRGAKEVVPRAFFGNPRLADFEDTQMPIPEKAEEYMTHIYGDYMAFPPEHERVPLHYADLHN